MDDKLNPGLPMKPALCPISAGICPAFPGCHPERKILHEQSPLAPLKSAARSNPCDLPQLKSEPTSRHCALESVVSALVREGPLETWPV
jgi:hypothetical protein